MSDRAATPLASAQRVVGLLALERARVGLYLFARCDRNR
jgi:hypothetical protein